MRKCFEVQTTLCLLETLIALEQLPAAAALTVGGVPLRWSVDGAAAVSAIASTAR